MTPEELHATHRWFPLAELQLLEGNPNIADEVRLGNSLDEFGWLHGIIVHDGVVLAGNHRVKQAVERGLAGLPGYDLSPLALSSPEVLARALAHNHTARAGRNDPKLEAEAFDVIGAVDRDLAALAGAVEDVDLLDLAPVSEPAGPDPGPPVNLSLRYFVLEYPAEAFPAVVAALNERRGHPDEPNTAVVSELLRNAYGNR